MEQKYVFHVQHGVRDLHADLCTSGLRLIVKHG